MMAVLTTKERLSVKMQVVLKSQGPWYVPVLEHNHFVPILWIDTLPEQVLKY